jgi:acetyl esterase
MPFDPVKALFDHLPHMPDLSMSRSPADARAIVKKILSRVDASDVAIGKTQDIDIDGPAGTVPVRVYTPIAAGGGSLPVLVFYHGGGFILGDLDDYDPLCRSIANESGCRIISVGYRLAPEHAFPAAVEDAFAALKWVEAHAGELEIDPNRIAVGGDSAGGNLAAVVTHLAKQAGGPHIAFQLLIYPLTRMRRDQEWAENMLPWSIVDPLTMGKIRDLYVPAGSDLNDIRLSPAAAADFTGLPPAYIVTAGLDPLRESGTDYAEKLKSAGVAVQAVDYATMVHGFFCMQGVIAMAREAVAATGQALKAALAEK